MWEYPRPCVQELLYNIEIFVSDLSVQDGYPIHPCLLRYASTWLKIIVKFHLLLVNFEVPKHHAKLKECRLSEKIFCNVLMTTHLSHNSHGWCTNSFGDFVFNQIEHVLVIKKPDQMEWAKAGCASQGQVTDYHGTKIDKGKVDHVIYPHVWSNIYGWWLNNYYRIGLNWELIFLSMVPLSSKNN